MLEILYLIHQQKNKKWKRGEVQQFQFSLVNLPPLYSALRQLSGKSSDTYCTAAFLANHLFFLPTDTALLSRTSVQVRVQRQSCNTPVKTEQELCP